MGQPISTGGNAPQTGSRASPRRRPSAAPRLPWTRRLGVGLAIFALGASLVLAGSGALGRDPGVDPSLGASPGAQATEATEASAEPTRRRLDTPTLEGRGTRTARATWTASGTIPSAYVGRRAFRIRIMRNDRVVAEARVGDAPRYAVEVPLRPGRNAFSARLAGLGTRSEDSPQVVVVYDTEPPPIVVTMPGPGEPVRTAVVDARGTSEAGTRLTLLNRTSQQTASATAGEDGQWATRLRLTLGPNDISITAVDQAGNRAATELTVVREEGGARAELTLSQRAFRIRSLPSQLSIRVLVLDEQELPVDGAPVTFSVSPPGLPTSTYRAVTERGAASWLNIDLPRVGAIAGAGFATVLVEMPGGGTLRETAPFSFR